MVNNPTSYGSFWGPPGPKSPPLKTLTSLASKTYARLGIKLASALPGNIDDWNDMGTVAYYLTYMLRYEVQNP